MESKKYIMIAVKVKSEKPKEVVAYVLYDTKLCKKFDCLSKELSQYVGETSNLGIKDSEVVGTCGNILRYARIDAKKGLVDENGVAAPSRKPLVIIGKDDNGRFVCVDYKGDKVRLKAQKAVYYVKKFGIANGKLITSYGKEYLSSLSGNFPVLTYDITEIKRRQIETLKGSRLADSLSDIDIKEVNGQAIFIRGIYYNKVDFSDTVDRIWKNSLVIENKEPVEIVIGKNCIVDDSFLVKIDVPIVETLEYTGYNQSTLLNLLKGFYKCRINRLIINASTLNENSIRYLFKNRFMRDLNGEIQDTAILDIISNDNSVASVECFKSSLEMVLSLYIRFKQYNKVELDRLRVIQDAEKPIFLQKLERMINANSEVLSSTIEVLSPIFTEECEEAVCNLVLKKTMEFWSEYMPSK